MFDVTICDFEQLITICDKFKETWRDSEITVCIYRTRPCYAKRNLKSDKAIEVNIAIMRAFVHLRQFALSHKELTDKLRLMEKESNRKFKDVYEALDYLLKKDKQLI